MSGGGNCAEALRQNQPTTGTDLRAQLPTNGPLGRCIHWTQKVDDGDDDEDLFHPKH